MASFILLGDFIAGGLVVGYFGVRHLRGYLRMGKGPEQITAAQAFEILLDSGPDWVRLGERLRLNCEHALRQISSGSVEFTEYLAQDDTGQHAFLLQYKGDTDCNAANARPLEGLFAVPPMYWWKQNNMPVLNSQPVELQVGYAPTEGLYESIWGLLAALIMLGLVALAIARIWKM